MTYKELLNSVSFDEVASFILKMYPDTKENLGWYKIHFDMLRHLTPVYHEDTNDLVCSITLENWEDGKEPCLAAFPMEGELWEHSLTKEIILASDVNASKEEIAACCLWHTSFYGFVNKDVKDTFKYEIELQQRESFKSQSLIIQKHGGVIPYVRELSTSKKQELMEQAKHIVRIEKEMGIHMNGPKRKRLLRQSFMSYYYERMTSICSFILQVIPTLYDVKTTLHGSPNLCVRQLCNLFQSDKFCSEEIMSYADCKESGVAYLQNVIFQYNMIPEMDGIFACLTIGRHYTTQEEYHLLNYLAIGRCFSDFIINIDSSLNNQAIIRYDTYNSRKRLLFLNPCHNIA